MRYYLLKFICSIFAFTTRLLVKPFVTEDKNRQMLKWFLEWDRTQRQHWIATFAFPICKGTHPKNISGTRIKDLRNEVDRFSEAPLRVIDFGCGSGRTLELLSTRISEGLGIDLVAPKNEVHNEIHLKFPQITFEYQEHTPATLSEKVKNFKPDLVILSHILEHIEKPVDYLKAFHPFPILACVPSEESWIQILRKDLDLSTSSDSTHFREYTQELVKIQLAEAGYRPDLIRYNPEGELVFIARGIQAPNSL